MILPESSGKITLSKKAFAHNLAFIKNLIGDQVIYSSVVKGNAYGHGTEEFCRMAASLGVQHFCVFSADEAYRLLKSVNIRPLYIIIMGYIHPDELPWVIEHEIGFFVYNNTQIQDSLKAAKKVGKIAKIHLELETGMNRTGFLKKELTKALLTIANNEDWLDIEGVCTHYAGAESIANYHRVNRQQVKFRNYVLRLKRQDINPKYIHSACSAAAISYPATRYNLARIGILQYGFFPSQEILVRYLDKNKLTAYPLKRVLSWKSRVIDIKEVKTGEFVGYGTSYFTNFPTKIAQVPIGYANGFARSLSNQGKVLINGHRVNVIGIVNMNLLTIDVTNIPHVSIGDEVVLIGDQGESSISVSSFGEVSQLLNYELLVRLSSNIKREIIDD